MLSEAMKDRLHDISESAELLAKKLKEAQTSNATDAELVEKLSDLAGEISSELSDLHDEIEAENEEEEEEEEEEVEDED